MSRYHGQWWDLGGNSFCNVLVMVWPIFFLIFFQYKKVVAVQQAAFPQKRLDSLSNKNVYGPFMKFNFMLNPVY